MQSGKAVPVSSLIPIMGFIDDLVWLTYSGDCGVILRLRGTDCECREPREIADLVKRFEQACRFLDHTFRLYQYFFRQKVGQYYEQENYLALVKLGKPQKPGLLSTNRFTTLVREEVETVRSAVRQSAETFSHQLTGCRILLRDEAFQFLRRLVNFSPHLLDRKAPTEVAFINFQVADSVIEAHGRGQVETGETTGHHLRVDDYFVRVLTLSELGQATRPLMLEATGTRIEGLQRIKGNFFLCSEWHPVADGAGIIGKMRDIIDNFKADAKVGSKKKALDNMGSVEAVKHLGVAQKRLYDGEKVGEYSLTAVVYDGDTVQGMESTQREIERIFSLADCKLRPETYNQLGAYMATIPASPYQIRKLKIMDPNAADLGFFYVPECGQAVNADLGMPALLRLETNEHTAFDLNLHHAGKGHSLIVGGSGSGKSFLLNVLVSRMIEVYKPTPFIVIIDKGGSFRWLVEHYGGYYFELRAADLVTGFRQFQINPFACEGTKENLDFLALLCRFLMEHDSERLTAEESAKLYAAIERILSPAMPREERRLSLLASLLCVLGKRLKPWCRGGQYGWVFDNIDDTLNLADLQCFEFQGMEKLKVVRDALCMVIHHRADQVIFDRSEISRVKASIVDEAWSTLADQMGASRIEDESRTGRKNNNMVILSTQSVGELEGLDAVLEACSTRIFLANPDFNREKYGEVFNLSPAKLDRIETLIAQQQMLFCQPGSAKVLNLFPTPEMLALASNDPKSNAARREAQDKHGGKWMYAMAGNGEGR